MRGEDGASLVEYVLLISLILIVCVVGVAYLGGNVRSGLDSTGSAINTATTP